ncbi:hypothetical protein BCR33DRAFT_761576 [Rhizoclosmatium globosum]|uniref:CRAL-TRIO domain-containing protein n=1 Tax=Rhizoclosmatium globosum TaxID=329046 RepID=A0A1Y2CZQ7_9FUNG|nr:hypothetical protein BCR33DRAFT_761576 [Rhizoclosmatium globosum]|eukprot:ORY52356.1 hypothetical protein BCR33DRAFT_761576 [Rhizoclosmatium globosum]
MPTNFDPILTCRHKAVPLAINLTESQRKAITSLYAQVPTILASLSLPAEEVSILSKWADEGTCRRVLNAVNFQPEAAITRLKATMKWRSEFKPDRISPMEIEVEAQSGKIFLTALTARSSHPHWNPTTRLYALISPFLDDYQKSKVYFANPEKDGKHVEKRHGDIKEIGGWTNLGDWVSSEDLLVQYGGTCELPLPPIEFLETFMMLALVLAAASFATAQVAPQLNGQTVVLLFTSTFNGASTPQCLKTCMTSSGFVVPSSVENVQALCANYSAFSSCQVSGCSAADATTSAGITVSWPQYCTVAGVPVATAPAAPAVPVQTTAAAAPAPVTTLSLMKCSKSRTGPPSTPRPSSNAPSRSRRRPRTLRRSLTREGTARRSALHHRRSPRRRVPRRPRAPLRLGNRGECNRFMRATKWDLKASRKRLADTIQWRFDYKPDLIDPAQIECEGGFDKGGHPMLFLVPSNPKVADSNYDRAIRFSVYMLERAIRLMPEGVERLDLIIDYENVTRATATPLSVSLKYLNIFSSHYPERLNMGIMINPSWYLPFFLGLLSPFMDPVTKSKINMVNLKDTSPSTGTTKGTGGWIKILDYIDEDQLPTRYGGTFEFQYEHETYWPKLIAM